MNTQNFKSINLYDQYYKYESIAELVAINNSENGQTAYLKSYSSCSMSSSLLFIYF